MANPLYHIYIGKLKTTPENWDSANEAAYDHANGWVEFVCPSFQDTARNNNTLSHLAGHSSYRINTGKTVQSMTLKDVIITNTDGSTDSDYYNAVKEFLLRHMLTGDDCGYDLYLHVYDPSGSGQYIKFMDSGETMQLHCQITIIGFNFTLDHSGIYRGNIMLEEVQDD